MRIAKIHSHLNGLEFLEVHEPQLWEQVQDVIATVEAGECRTKTSKGRGGAGILLYSPTEMNKQFHLQLTRHDFEKKRIAIEVRFGKYPSFTHDLFGTHLVSYIRDEIDVGIEILAMKSMQAHIWSGARCYEAELYDVLRNGRGVPAVPLVIVGVLP